jgi:hypothetical protein
LLSYEILLAGILGGIAMFIWTSIAHLVLPLGEAGIQEIPNESAVLSAMQSNIGDQTGVYIFFDLRSTSLTVLRGRSQKFPLPVTTSCW